VCAEGEVEVSPCTATEDAVCEPAADGGLADAGAGDGGVPGDASLPADAAFGGDAGAATSVDAGCGCVGVGARRGGSPAGWALLGLAFVAVRRRRRRGPSR
jgi:MYXO-CTERM domain-containing protein